MREVLFKISGNVQGVGFRVLVQRIARSLKIKGWVQNEPDDSVSVLAQGSNESLRLFESRISSIHYPLGPNVEKIELANQKELGDSCTHPDFLIAA